MMNWHFMSRSTDEYEPNRWVPFGAAIGFHLFLIIWNPTILKASPYTIATPMITVKVMDHLPVLEPPKRAPVPKVEKKPVHKAKKSGLSPVTHPRPISITPHHMTPKAPPKPVAPKLFVSRITMPKFVPHQADEPMAASPLP